MIGYLDIPSGISGDMFLGCLVDAGWPIEALRQTLRQLKVPSDEWTVESSVVMKGPMRATFVDVRVAPGQHHRGLSTITDIIQNADLPEQVQRQAVAVFTRLAQAEAKVHGTTVEAIHFHEVGAMDAIVDIVGTCAGLTALGIERLYCSALPMGSGWAQTDHGQIPLPAPATLELLAAAGAPTRPAPGPGEWVTPTGAALVAELASFVQPIITVKRIGTGAGQRDCAWPNVARLWVGQATPVDGDSHSSTGLLQIDTNIDDMNPQLFAAVSEALFAAGARDVWLTPIQMKKNRPAVVLSALTDAAREAALADIILRQTTTLGLRVHPVHRHEARRELRQVDTDHGQVTLKLKFINDELVGAMPEFDDVQRLAREVGLDVKRVYDAAIIAANRLVSENAPALILQAPAPVAAAHSHDHSHSHDHGHSHDHAHDHRHDHGHKHDHNHGKKPRGK